MYIQLNNQIVKICNEIISVRFNTVQDNYIAIVYKNTQEATVIYYNNVRDVITDYNKIKKILTETSFNLEEIDP